jgi:hypothetical protein
LSDNFLTCLKIQLDPTIVELVAWRDNDRAYAAKLLDLALTVG